MPEYLQQANDNILILTQIETLEAYNNLEELCSVEGLGSSIVGTS